MGYDFDKTHESILESAARHFLDAGFAGASIRQICRDAGVTNGAFYAHFESKDDLFASLVEPTLEGLNNLYGAEASRFREIHSTDDVLEALDLAFSADEAIIRYIYDHAEAFNLLLKANGGTSYEQLPDSIAETEKENTLAFFELCKPFVNKPENISGSIAAQASTFIVKTVFDCLLSGKSESEAIREAQLASEFCLAGLKQIWGI
ncbi:Potential acrAB operon repressor [Slackia heliotrinireducens]|uniref:Transcriptional regulator n=1 Tax=Slackia heliotrinireducens (strain ATCC 29202 / DSM 20476 / NCTC 11029 / RHS 1) TaxID=471855 RepID=C7N481_SLAHD|nr:TetR/AcrR family transcriptional regulator [Slackia heliotrinireducens]ACV23817.1 transcriptional regulator [Slackia heliotrinireducens DSM 20476]VEH03505.1 Potential acrAB operon repressor [Slackia heliotrinireducens]